MTTEINLVGQKQSFLTNTSFLNEGKAKFLEIKQDTKKKRKQKEKKLPKYEKWCTWLHTHDTPSPVRRCTHSDDCPPFLHQLRTDLIDGQFLNIVNIEFTEMIKNKLLDENINGSAGWNKLSREHH